MYESESFLVSRRAAVRPLFVNHYRYQTVDFRITRDKLVVADFETFYQEDLASLERRGLAGVYTDSRKEGYVIVACGKNWLPEGFYDVFLSCFPHQGHPVVQTLEELSTNTRDSFLDSVGKGVQAVALVAAEEREELGELYAYQHIAVNENDNPTPVANNFPHIHWHTFGIPKHLEARHLHRLKMSKKRALGSAYWDPTIVIAYDFMRELYPAVRIDTTTSALEIQSETYDFTISAEERNLLVAIMHDWKKTWTETAACYTDFETENGQYKLIATDERKKRLAELFAKHPELGDKSQGILLWLADSLTQVAPTVNNHYNWNLAARGIHGSVGFRFDTTQQTKSLRLAPRTFTVAEKSAATGGKYMLVRNGSDQAPQDVTEKIERRQREIIKQIIAE